MIAKPRMASPAASSAWETNGVTEAARRGQLRQLLLSHLEAACTCFWPGGDGMLVDDVLLSYPTAAQQGLVPGAEKLLSQHPDLASEIRAFFGVAVAQARP